MTDKRRTVNVDTYIGHPIDINGKITANEHTLNYICSLASEAAERFEANGFQALAKEAQDFGDAIFKFLSEKGFYNKD